MMKKHSLTRHEGSVGGRYKADDKECKNKCEATKGYNCGEKWMTCCHNKDLCVDAVILKLFC